MKSNNQLPGVGCDALYAVGDVVGITAACMTTGKQGVIAAYHFGKWEVSFSPQWCGYYLPEQLRKISSANEQVLAQEGPKSNL